MDTYFFDTSALVKRYAPEPGTETVDALIESADSRIVISSLTVVEATSAARRKYNTGAYSERDVSSLLATFYREATAEFTIVPLDESAMAATFDLVLEHDLRTLDSLQLSSALRLAEEFDDFAFVCADRDLLEIGADRGLSTVDPVGSEG